MKYGFRIYILALLAVLMAHLCSAQRYYSPLPLGKSVYAGELKLPIAVQYYLPAWALGDAKRVNSWKFLADVPDSICLVHHQDYTRSGYDRGHMMAAADRSFDTGVMRATFVMSNVAPQTPALNRGPWAKAEEDVRDLARKRGEVMVYNAPVFFLTDTTYIEPAHIAVPHAFLKVAMNCAADSVYRVYFFLNR